MTSVYSCVGRGPGQADERDVVERDVVTPTPLHLFRAVTVLMSDQLAWSIIHQMLQKLVGCACRLQRSGTLEIPTVHGVITSVEVSTSKGTGQISKLLIMIRDNTSQRVKTNASMVREWIYQYAEHMKRPLCDVGSGWQEIVARIHYPSAPGADAEGYVWYPLSCLIPKEVRDLVRPVMHRWLKDLVPWVDQRVDTVGRAEEFLARHQTPLQEIMSRAQHLAVTFAVQEMSPQGVPEDPDVLHVLAYIRKSANRNQQKSTRGGTAPKGSNIAPPKSRKRRAIDISEGEDDDDQQARHPAPTPMGPSSLPAHTAGTTKVTSSTSASAVSLCDKAVIPVTPPPPLPLSLEALFRRVFG